MTYSFSSWLKKRAWAGERGNRKNEAAPKTTVNRPSRINIHAQPGLPPTLFMLMMPNARRPEKAPEIDAAEKNADILEGYF